MRQNCLCGNEKIVAHGMCRSCYDDWYLHTHLVPKRIQADTCLKPEKVEKAVSRFVGSIPVSKARQDTLGKVLLPGVRANAERFWGAGE